MTVSPDDVFGLIDKIRYDLTAAQGKITDLKIMLAELSEQLPERRSQPECSVCHVRHATDERLADHMRLVHPGVA